MAENEIPQTEQPRIPPAPPQPPPPAPQLPHKSPILAGFLSFVFPGLGHLYLGLYRRGIVFFIIWAIAFGIAVDGGDEPLLIMFMIFVWLFNIFDAYRQATLLHLGLTSDPDLLRAQASDLGSWGLIPGVVLLLLGFYGLLREWLDLDLSWLVDQWPIAVMGLGAWMIYQTLKQRKETETTDLEPEA